MDPALVRDAASSAAEGVAWESLGLVSCIIGSFLLANGVLLRDPRAIVAQRLARTPPALRSARELLFHRVQVGLGFLFLILGFALQLVGSTEPPGSGPDVPGSIALWVGALVVLALALEGLGWWVSLVVFRRQVRGLLRAQPPDLSADVQLARELGEIFGARSHAEDTVQAYLERLHAAIGLAPPSRARRRGPVEHPPDVVGGSEPFEPGEGRPPPGRGLPRLR